MEQRGYFLTPDRTDQSDSFSYTISPVQVLPSHQKSATSKPPPSASLSSSSLLKGLSSRVQTYLKESHRSVQFHEHNQDIITLKRSNMETQTVLDQFRGRTLSFKSDATQKEPTGSKADINSVAPKLEGSSRNKEGTPSRKQSLRSQEQSPSKAALKRQLMTAIHLAIQTNDEKLCKQQKYVSELQRRVSKLQDMERKVDVLKFEREVRLQASPKKVKNFSLRTAPINGEEACDEPLMSPRERYDDKGELQGQGMEKREIRFFVNPHKRRLNEAQNHNGTHAQRSGQFRQLQETCSLLQQRLQIQKQSRLQQATRRQTLQKKISYLQEQNKRLLTDLTSLQQRLRFHQEKYADLQLFLHTYRGRSSGKIHPNLPQTISSELNAITNQLRLCGVEQYHAAERDMADLIINKELLQEEVADLQRKIVEGCKFSCTHREVFLLKDKLAALEKQCRKYQQELHEYRRDPSSQDKKQEQLPSCLKWGRLLYFCVSSAVARLQALQKQAKG